LRRIFTFLFAAGALVSLVACLGSDSGPTGPVDPAELEFAAALGINLAQMTKTGSGLYYQDLVVGDGDDVQAGATVTVHYEGWLHDGTKFDSSRDRGEPSTFSLGEVIPGFSEGVPGMQVGGRRKLVVPSHLAYDRYGTANGVIPPYATLVFDIELLGIGP
jgi:FKBP-type peptidyl-prolyl cis-trans isomerase